MKTDDLIAALSANPRSVSRMRPTPTIVGAALVACSIVAVLSIVWLGPRADLWRAFFAGPHLLILNLVFALSVGSIALANVRDLSVPGRRRSLSPLAVGAPFLVMGALALYEIGTSLSDRLSDHVDHTSWLICLWRIAILAVPAFAILVVGIKRLAPVNLRRTGAYVGILAGAIGSMGYCLHAEDQALLFDTTVHTSAIVVMAVIGWISGPRLLRWT